MPSGKTAVRGGDQLVVGCFLDEAARHLSRNNWSWIGRARCVFFRKSFVVPSIWVSTMGLQSARASLSPRLAKEFATPSLSSQLNRSGSDEMGMQSKILTGASHRP